MYAEKIGGSFHLDGRLLQNVHQSPLTAWRWSEKTFTGCVRECLGNPQSPRALDCQPGSGNHTVLRKLPATLHYECSRAFETTPMWSTSPSVQGKGVCHDQHPHCLPSSTWRSSVLPGWRVAWTTSSEGAMFWRVRIQLPGNLLLPSSHPICWLWEEFSTTKEDQDKWFLSVY